MKYAVVIPARYQSSRFPGKPLVDLLGKPMIQHVWERCCEAVGKDLVYVATDSELIRDKAKSFGAQVVMTSTQCMTGTDRLAEANEQLNCEFLINVQGDEPLVNPHDIQSVIDAYTDNPETVINAMCSLKDKFEYLSLTVPKVVTSISGNLLYMSRSPIPGNKKNTFIHGYKQICIYAFSAAHLKFFVSIKSKTTLEEIEDIEILRFLENDIPVQMVEVNQGSVAIDTPDDVQKVLDIMEKGFL